MNNNKKKMITDEPSEDPKIARLRKLKTQHEMIQSRFSEQTSSSLMKELTMFQKERERRYVNDLEKLEEVVNYWLVIF